jgi:secondary thiamine-phosphate synthase enzyme
LATYSGELRLTTAGDGDTIDLTEGVGRIVAQSGAGDGAVTVFVPGSTAAITTMEFERGGVHDLKAALDRLIPPEGDYEHNRLNHDSNSHAHMRAAIVGPSETIPVREGRPRLGIWQQIVLLDFDDRPRERKVIVTVSL